jgi:hypothetical protein
MTVLTIIRETGPSRVNRSPLKPPFLLDPKNHPFQVSSYHYSLSIRHPTICNKSCQLTALYDKVLHISTLAFLGIDRRRG